MNNLNDRYHLVYNQKDVFYLFELELTGKLICKKIDMEMRIIDTYTISNNNVIKFNLTLDAKNRINLIYLLKSGDLIQSINDGSSWTDLQIGKLDTRSNKYHQLEVLCISNKINIIYSLSNYINSEIISIQHLILNDKGLEQINVIKYVLRKAYNEFSLGFDDIGNIHLIYNTTTNFESYIYHSFYSPYRGSWSGNPKELSSRGKDNLMPYLFVDSRSNVHTGWLEKEDNHYKLKYSRMPNKGKDKYIWQDIDIPISLDNIFTPIIFERDGVIIILYYDEESITSLASRDFGDTWTNKVSRKISNTSKFIRFSYPSTMDGKLIVKNLLAINSKIDNLEDLYLDGIINSDKKKASLESISGDILDLPLDQRDDIVEKPEVSSHIPFDKEELRSMIYELITEETDILKQILNYQEEILEELESIKKMKNQGKTSLADRLFRGN